MTREKRDGGAHPSKVANSFITSASSFSRLLKLFFSREFIFNQKHFWTSGKCFLFLPFFGFNISLMYLYPTKILGILFGVSSLIITMYKFHYEYDELFGKYEVSA